ncbi:MAG: hypothetical protein ACRELX_12035 [Longimicrobiales bacterium]
MTGLYWFALVLGAGLLLVPLLGDFFGGEGGAANASLHDGGQTHTHDHATAEGMKILSMRNITYFLFGFGAAGLLLSWLWQRGHPIGTAAFALALGIVSGGISALAFGWLGRTESGAILGDQGWSGCVGEVVLPLSNAGTGKVLVARAGREHTLLARPFDEQAREPETWRAVVVIEMRRGIALVEPYTNALEDDAPLRLTSNAEQ